MSLLRWPVIAVLLLAAGPTACGDVPRPPLRIGINPWPGYEFLYIAQERGYFVDEGVPVKLVEYGSLGDVRRGYETGQVDAMCTTVVEVLHSLLESTRRPRIVIPTDFSNGADVVIARDGVALGDLEGRRVAVEKFSLGYLMLARALDRANLGLRDVQAVPMDLSQMSDAMRRGVVDAAVSYPPESVAMMADGLGQVVFSSRDIPGEILDVVSFDASVLEARRDDIERVVRSFDRAVEFSRAHPDEVHALIASRERITPDAVRDAMSGMSFPSAAERAQLWRDVVPGVVKRTDRVLREAGLLTGADRTDEVLQGGRLFLDPSGAR